MGMHVDEARQQDMILQYHFRGILMTDNRFSTRQNPQNSSILNNHSVVLKNLATRPDRYQISCAYQRCVIHKLGGLRIRQTGNA